IALDVEPYIVHPDAHAAGRRVDDALIRLMWNEKLHILSREAVALHDANGRIGHSFDGILEDGAPFLAKEMHALVDGLVGGWIEASATQHAEEIPVLAVDPLVEIDEPIRSEETRLNSSHVKISYAVFCLKKKKT